jgi:hypothetical protein
MIAKLLRSVVSPVLCLAVAGGASAWAQQAGKTKDDALDSLIEKLTGSEDDAASKSSSKTAKPKKPAETPKSQAGRSSDESKDAPRSNANSGQTGKSSAAQTGKPSAPKSPGAGSVAPKDQAIDDLLEKLGETKEKPAPEDHPRNPGAAEEPKEPSRQQKPGPAKLGGKDKDIDERLEEYAGRKKRRPAADEERNGPIGEIIKEMRDVEQRLGKPDPSEDTQNKQKQIVKHIEKLIEDVRKSGSSGSRLVLRRVRQPGQRGGQEPGEQGALARGAPPMKPGKPTSQHSTAGSKEIWGHLPAELRQAMEASFKEVSLSTKAEIISRYFLSVTKGKLVREE